MNLSCPFILRPVATSLLMLALLLVGLIAMRLLPVSALPEVEYPTIQIATRYPGASAWICPCPMATRPLHWCRHRCWRTMRTITCSAWPSAAAGCT